MLTPLISDALFVETLSQLLLLMLIIVAAGIVRGCIGFGFSAIVVASSSFWLPPVAVVNLVVLLEVAASLALFRNVRRDVLPSLLTPLVIGSFATTILGTWLLGTLATSVLQWIIGVYLVMIALLSLSGYQFNGEADTKRVFLVGLVAGLFNGLAAIGGVFAAWGLVGLRQPVRNIRATMSVYFLFVEAIFLATAYWNDLISAEILTTALLSVPALLIGIRIGSLLFGRYDEATLKRIVLIALVLISSFGLYQTMF